MKVKGIAKLLSVVMAMTCVSFPAISHAEDTAAAETTAVAKNLFSRFWGGPDSPNGMSNIAYGSGYSDKYGTYDPGNTSSYNPDTAVYKIDLNDNTLSGDELTTITSTDDFASGKTVNARQASSKGIIEKAIGWGYAGFQSVYNSTLDINRGAILDLTDYMDNGSISFVVNADGQDVSEAYLTVGFFKDLYDMGFTGDGAYAYRTSFDDTTIAKLEEKGVSWYGGRGNFFHINLNGVPLSKYYDSAKGGEQVVTVPLSEFADNAEFKGFLGYIDKKLSTEEHTEKFNPALVKTVGIARTDSGSGKTFSIEIKEAKLVAPKKVTNFIATKEADGVQLVWEPTTDTDVTYKVLKTVNGATEEIVPETEGEYLDTNVDLTEDGPEIRYSIAAVAEKYGVYSVSDEILINEKVATTAIAKNLFSRFWGGADSSNGMGNFAYGSGYSSQWGDYEAVNTSSYNPDTAAYIINLNDNTLTDDGLMTVNDINDFANGKTVNARQAASRGIIEKATGWGYAGFSAVYNSTLDINRGAILDLTDYMDNGSISFVINADGQDVSEAYLTVGFFKNLYDMGFTADGAYAYSTSFDDATTAILKEKGVNWYGGKGNFFHMNLSGVPLSKYYDSTKGGDQVVTVPLSEFANNAEFRKMAGKIDQKLSTAEHTEEFNPALIKTVGIARTDSGSGKTFGIQVKEAKLIAPKMPRGFAAEKVSNGVKLTWKNTTDTDVTYKIVKTVNGETTYIDAESGYIDTDVNLDDTDTEVRYAVAAVAVKYGAEVKTEEIIFNEQVKTNPFKEKLMTPYWGDNNAVTYVYGAGYSSEYGDYDSGSSAIQAVTQNSFTAVLNDNTLTDSELLTSTDFASGKKINPRDNSKSFGLIEKATGWGYAGFAIKNSGGTNEAHNGAVIDARKYANGSISFTIDATGQKLDGAYLTLGYYKNLYEGEFWLDAWQPVHNAAALDADIVTTLDGISKNWVKGNGNYKTLRLVGVPLSKYYDSTKGGYQTITIPFSEFAENAVFNKAAGKIDNGGNQLSDADWDNSLNLALLKSAGIARLDSSSNTKFTVTVKDMSIIAPKEVKTFTAERVSNGVQLNWKETTDENVKYEIVKKVNRTEEIITPTESGAYLDQNVNLDDTTTEVRYAIRVTDTVYGAQVTTDEIVFNEIENTKGVKETVYASSRTSDMAGFAYAVGYASQYGDYEKTGASEVNGELSIVLNDNTFEDAQLYKRGSQEFATGVLTNPQDSSSEGIIEKATGWGYSGRILTYNKANDTHPAGVMDARAYADNAQVIFNVDATGQNLDGVYLTAGYFSNLGNLAFWTEDYGTLATEINLDKAAELTAANAGWKTNTGNYKELDFAGVPLADYYDSAKGGYQTIIVPLSEFIENSSFNKFAVKVGAGQLSKVNHANKLNPALIKTLGIARMDSGADTAVNFTAKIKDIAIAAPSAVTKLTAQANTESVKLSWLISTDTDTAGYEIFRNGKKIAAVTDTEYVDSEDLASGEYTYEVRAVSSAFDGLYSPKTEVKAVVPIKNSIAFTDGNGEPLSYTVPGTINVKLMSITADTQGYAALFDNSGMLKSVKTAALGGEEKTVTFTNVLAGDKVKAFIWNNDMTPVCEAKAIGERTTNVLVIGDELSAQASDYVDEIAKGAGKGFTVTNAYITGGKMADHYSAVTDNGKVYTKSVNGVVSGGTFSLNDILASNEWDYVILQDKSVYAGIDSYYADGEGDYMTQLPKIKEAIDAAAPNAALFAGEGWGYTPDYLNNANASEEDKAAYELVGNFTDTTGSYAAMAEYYINMVLGGGEIKIGETMAEYTEDGSAVIGSNGCDLNETGKFFASAMIYRILTNTAVTDAFVPSAVTDAASILALVNGQ